MLQIRRSTYHGKAGFLICGRVEGYAFPARVFARTRPGAVAIKAALLRNDLDGVDAILRNEAPLP